MKVISIILLTYLIYVTVLELFLMFHLILRCGNNFKLIASPDFSVLWVSEFFLINKNKVYRYSSNMVEVHDFRTF